MAIWTELLSLGGHIATPPGLAAVAPDPFARAPRAVAGPAPGRCVPTGRDHQGPPGRAPGSRVSPNDRSG